MPGESYDPSYYEVLGVPEDADATTIGKAFALSMRSVHPDRNAGDGAEAQRAAEERSRLLTQARSVLTGPDRRGYDERLRRRRAGHRPPTATGSGMHHAPSGPDQETVLPLTRQRWLEGGTLVPKNGGRPISVPAGAGPGEVLTFAGRGYADPAGGPPGDLHVRIVHVDARGDELPRGHPQDRGSGGRRHVPLLRLAAVGVAMVLVLVVVGLTVA